MAFGLCAVQARCDLGFWGRPAGGHEADGCLDQSPLASGLVRCVDQSLQSGRHSEFRFVLLRVAFVLSPLISSNCHILLYMFVVMQLCRAMHVITVGGSDMGP